MTNSHATHRTVSLSLLGFLLTFLFVPSLFSQDDHLLDPIISEIRILGNRTTKNYIILREMSLNVGDRITPESLKHDQQRIYDLQLFNKVDLQYTIEGEEATLYVIVHERWYIFPLPIIGVKYRDPKNLYYGGAILHQNFRGRNEKVFLLMTFGFDRWLELNYYNPRLTADCDYYFQTYIRLAKVQNLRPHVGMYEQQRYGGRILVGKRFGLYQFLSIWVDRDIWIVPQSVRDGTISSTGRDAFSSLGLSYTYDTRDMREYTTEGDSYSIFATKNGFGESGVDFFRYGSSLRAFRKVMGDVSVGGRVFGTMTGGGRVPPYRYLYFGYEERIRGHFSKILEGENIIGANVECRIPILSPKYFSLPEIPIPQFSLLRFGLYAGLFVDAGKVWYRHEGFAARGWSSGIGGGLHIILPYSIVLRTEYAWNEKGADEFVLDIGASF